MLWQAVILLLLATPFVDDYTNGDFPAGHESALIYSNTVEIKTHFHSYERWFGADGATALAAGDYLELVYKPAAVTAEAVPLEVQGEDHDAGTKVWLRLCVPDQNTGTMDFYIGLHEYD